MIVAACTVDLTVNKHTAHNKHTHQHHTAHWMQQQMAAIVLSAIFVYVSFPACFTHSTTLMVTFLNSVKEAIRSHEEKEKLHTAPSTPVATPPAAIPGARLARSSSHSTFYTRTPSYDRLDVVSEQAALMTQYSGNHSQMYICHTDGVMYRCVA